MAIVVWVGCVPALCVCVVCVRSLGCDKRCTVHSGASRTMALIFVKPQTSSKEKLEP